MMQELVFLGINFYMVNIQSSLLITTLMLMGMEETKMEMEVFWVMTMTFTSEMDLVFFE